jgi:S1-C subfamily serine protease
MEIAQRFLSNDLEEQEAEEMDFCIDEESTTTSSSSTTTTTEIPSGLLSTSSSGSKNESKQWMESLEKAIRAIVSIRLLSVRAFDGNGASFSVATGFVVDLKRGIILTNRHVVTPGPVVADAIFLNKEEVDLIPIYR